MSNNFEKFDKQAEEGSNIAIVAYITLLGTIIAMFMNMEKKNTFASFHVRQALGLNIIFYGLAYIIGNIDSWIASAAFYVFFIVLWIYGFSGAIQKNKTEIPFVGKYFQNWFKNI